MTVQTEPRIGFLAHLSERQREALHGIGTVMTIPAGRRMYGEGASAPSLAVLLEGRMKILTTTREGVEVLLAVRGPGDLLGEMSALIGAPRSAAVVALEPVRLLVVPVADFERLLATEPQVASSLIRTLVDRLREASDVRADLCEEVPVRVGRLLIRLAEQFGVSTDDGSVLIDLPLTQDELAGLTSVSRGGVAAALRELRAVGLVRTGRRSITVIDLDRLRSLTP